MPGLAGIAARNAAANRGAPTMDSQFHRATSNDGSVNYAGSSNYSEDGLGDVMPGDMILRGNLRQDAPRGLLNSAAVDDTSAGGGYVFTGNPTVEVPRSNGEPTVQVPRDRRGVTATNSGPSVETPTDRTGTANEPVPTRIATGGPPPPLGANYFANYFGPNGSGYTLFGANPPNRPEPSALPAEVYGAQGAVNFYSDAHGAYGHFDPNDPTGNTFIPVSGGATANLSPGATGGTDGNAPTGAQGSGGATVASNTRGATGTATGTAATANPYASTGYGSRAEFQARRASDLALMGEMSNGGEPNRFDTPDERGATTDPTPGGSGWGVGLAGMAARWTDAQKNAALFNAFHSAQFKGAG